jgi:transposase InsO family protein
MVQYLCITLCEDMYMPYTTNPHMPRVRIEAARLITEKGWSTRQAARHTGFNQSTIVRWANILRKSDHRQGIPTLSSRPYSHPDELPQETVKAIVSYRLKHRRCAEVIHYLMARDGYTVSLSSVKRTLKRAGLTRYSKWKKWHQYDEKPKPECPGVLVEIDTILDGPYYDRIYIYTMLDVCSRWSFAMPVMNIGTHASWEFIREARKAMPFQLQLVQSDHGSEFSKWFTKTLNANDISHRHSRVREPTDNAHVERFNRTIQEECLLRIPKTFESYRKAIPEYLHYYNNERPHMGIDMKTPMEVMQSY